ncbi:M91 family zinc metallopeptidase [Aquimarina megaterium]|uniref:M91 family zinc metallopeptidase n=1 Tax=Aquimarina megaterium TaxID=1443666 RepID=UPI0005550284|nr:M91 family zinc metallopeptidase [Aquimarina megaterium]
MKKKYLYFIFLMYFGIINAQNPFEKFGYEPKIGTLSKGKYIEHFDNDSIVQIGTILLNTRSKQIVGFVEETVTYSESTLEPSISSRWMNPDPLSDEFPDKSPYNFVNNNPIRYIDPLGLSPFDVIIEGEQAFRDEAFANLQSLTDSQLSMDENGKVTIVESGCNSGCEEGQNLVDGLIENDAVVTITKSADGQNRTEEQENGNSKIEINLDKTTGGVDIDGNKNRPSEIGLAHELGHSKIFANRTDDLSESNYVNPYEDNPNDGVWYAPNTYAPLDKTEARVRSKIENPIRRERGFKPRKMVRKSKFDYKKKF